MRLACAASLAALICLPVSAQAQAASDGYRVCAGPQTAQGLSVVREACGELHAPDFSGAAFTSLADLEAARQAREAFTGEVETYAACVSAFIDAYRRPGAPADSSAPDQAACAHSWAEEQATQAVRDYGRACIDFSNRSMRDARLTPWSGACYPAAGEGNG